MSNALRILKLSVTIGLLLFWSLPAPAMAAIPVVSDPQTVASDLITARSKIKHIVIILQENRSFDQYFGTYPGANGIPMQNGVPTVCNPDPLLKQCDKPYHNALDINIGGPHSTLSEFVDVDGGKMDGFVEKYRSAGRPCTPTTTPSCPIGWIPDVMGWHDAREIPNYWTYAKDFVLQDRMFAPSTGGSLPEHLFLVSEWSAKCSQAGNPASCVSALDSPTGINATSNDYPWTDLTYLLHKAHVSWAYYLSEGTAPDCADNMAICQSQKQSVSIPGIWNPLPAFDTVKHDNQLSRIQTVSNFYTAARAGTLPAVTWIIPNSTVSEHPINSIHTGQAYVTGLINAVMQGPAWDSTVVLLAWDDWGGFYDHVPPVLIDVNGYGIRVPGLMISAYARRGLVDHQTLSFDAYMKFIEDIFLNSRRIDPRTDGRPDPRPTVRENVVQLGNLLNEFNFTQTPLKPVILSVNPTPGPASIP